ncbi:MAG: type II toxin-antitoxin system prevent-host-death family antitoxin [Planctomycetota bacterium]
MIWKLAEAKNKLSEVCRLAMREGPQRIERRNDAFYVLSEEEFERLSGEKPDFIEFLLNAPDMSDLDLERSKEPMRELDL